MNPTIEKKMKEFQALALDQKKQIVMEMLEVLKDANDNFHYVYENIQILENVDDDLLDTIYQEVIELAEKKREKDKELEQDSFLKMKETIDDIKAKEAEEEKDNNADDLLNSI